ncbi:MAG: RNA-protein complex protein Nop10 [Thermoplasmata archaeon]
MTESILRTCRGCHHYTLHEKCPACGTETRTPHPARFNPNDRWGRYRRMLTEVTAKASTE